MDEHRWVEMAKDEGWVKLDGVVVVVVGPQLNNCSK